MGQHDLSYRLFFAHRRMIQDLLREIVGEGWVERIDFDSGERVEASFVSSRYENRESDVATDLGSLIGDLDPSAEIYRPQLRYRLVDEAAYPREELAALSSPVADLFRIEKSHDWLEVRASVHRLRQNIPPDEAALRRAFETGCRR